MAPTPARPRTGGATRPAGPPSTPQELVRWVPATFELPSISRVDVHAFSGDRWDDVRVCRKVTRGPFAMPRGHLASDLVAIVLSAPDREDGRFGPEHVTDRGRAGSVNVLPAGMPYTYSCEGTRDILHVSLSALEVAEDDAPGPPARLRPAFAVADPLIVQIAASLLRDATAPDDGGRLYGEALGSALAAHLARRYAAEGPRAAPTPGCIPGRQLRRVLEYVEAHLAEDLGLGELARIAGMSRTRFLHEFRRTTGKSPHRHVMERRIERAKVLLADPDVQLDDVVSASGYADQSSFTRVFRRMTHLTPGAYRRASRP